MVEISNIYPLDVRYGTDDDIPSHIRDSARYRDFHGYSNQDVANLVFKKYDAIYGLVHCIAIAPDIN